MQFGVKFYWTHLVSGDMSKVSFLGLVLIPIRSSSSLSILCCFYVVYNAETNKKYVNSPTEILLLPRITL